MNRLLPYFFAVFGLTTISPGAAGQCGYDATAGTNKDYCLGSSLVVHATRVLKKIVWYKDGQPVDSALARESRGPFSRITLDVTGVSGDLVSDKSGNIYTFDPGHHRIVKCAPATGARVSTVGYYRFDLGDWNTLFVDQQGNVYAASAVRKIVLKYSPGDTVGFPVVQAPGSQGTFGEGLYVDCQGSIYVCNGDNVTKWLPGASSGIVVAEAGGSTSNRLAGPIRVDSTGNIFALWFGQLTKWIPGDTTGSLVSSWNDPGGTMHMWMGADDSVLVMSENNSVENIAVVGHGNSIPQVLGGFSDNHGTGGFPSVTMDPDGNIYAMDDDDQNIYEQKIHSSIDSAFTPQDTGVYYAIATNMQGYSVITNKIVIGSPLSGRPSISITATATGTPVCTPIGFTANSGNFGLDPSFQWIVSGVPVGGDSTSYSHNLFADGDQVYCILTAQAGCSGQVSDTSNVITLSIDPHGAASLTISTSKDSICRGDTAIFTGTVLNGSSQPAFEWLVNGDSTSDDSATFIRSDLANGDVITCLITSDDVCGLAKSNSIRLTVSIPPTVEAGQIFTVVHGHSLVLEPVTSGDIDRWQWTPATGLSDTTIADPVASPDTNTLYTLSVAAPGGCSASGAILVNVYTPLSIPNAFSPNGDGHNDELYVLAGPVNSQVEDFAVFNRSGAEVFHVHDVVPGDKAHGWNGNVRGSPAPEGTYVYYVVMKLAGGKRQLYKGTVELIR